MQCSSLANSNGGALKQVFLLTAYQSPSALINCVKPTYTKVTDNILQLSTSS